MHDDEYVNREELFDQKYHNILINIKDYLLCSSSLMWQERNDDELTMIMFTSGTTGISKGVSLIENKKDIKRRINNAFKFSKSKKIIIEEYVEAYKYQVAGDGLSINGELVFRCFGNDHFDKLFPNPFVPVAASFPSVFSNKIQQKIHNEIQRLMLLLDMKSCNYNFDIRIDRNYNVYLMEIAPRCGGNYIPQIIKHLNKVDLVEAAIKLAMGEKININFTNTKGLYSYYAVHSYCKGVLKKIEINNLLGTIVEDYIINKKGDRIKPFTGSNTTLGCYIMKFNKKKEMLDMMDNSDKWIKVYVR